MKDVLNGQYSTFLIGLKYKEGNVLTADGEILGGVDDFDGNSFEVDDDYPNVLIESGTYMLYNDKKHHEFTFICQHN